MTFQEKANRIPPILCRLLARKDHGLLPMSHRDIARASTLAHSTVVKISRYRDWNRVTLRTIQLFSQACNVDLLHPKDSIRFWKRRRKAYLNNGSGSQTRMLDRMLLELSKGNRQNGTASPSSNVPVASRGV